MSIFSESAIEFFNTENRISALYIPKTGSSKTIDVIFDENEYENNYEGGSFNNSQIEIDVLTSDVPAIAQGDIFTIGSLDFQVIRKLPNQEGIITCMCSKGTPHILVPLEDDNVGITANGELLMAKI